MNNYDSFEAFETTLEDSVLTITLNRPGKENALTGAMHTEFTQIFSQVRSDVDVSVVVLTGAGEIFSGLPDMDWFATVYESDWLRLMREAKWLIHDMLNLPQPLVCALNGDAVGLAWSMASFADFIVAVEGAQISDAHISMALTAGDGGAMSLPFQMSLHRVKEFYMLNKTFSSEELYDLGMITKVVPRDQLASATREIVDTLLAQPKEALQWTKSILNRMMNFNAFMTTEQALGHEGWGWHLQPTQSGMDELRKSKGITA